MADIRGFRGFRYDLGRVGSLSDVVAPPYDVIGPELQQRLYGQNDFNAIRLELTRDEPGDNEAENKYARASRTLKEWVNDNVLRQDTARSLYIYEQEFEVEGSTHTRRGFFARVRLEPFGKGKIFAHEQTMAGPKEDGSSSTRTGQPLANLLPTPDPVGGRGLILHSQGPPRARKSRRHEPLWMLATPMRSAPSWASWGSALHRRWPPSLRDRPQVPGGAEAAGEFRR